MKEKRGQEPFFASFAHAEGPPQDVQNGEERHQDHEKRFLTPFSPVVVLTGPAACGKTTAAIQLYGEFAGDGRDGRSACMLIAPNVYAARRLRESLLAESSGGVLASPNVRTFGALAAAILAGASKPPRRLTAFRRHLLLTRIVNELLDEGKFKVLGAVADTPGLIGALDRSISELKRAAVEPDKLAKAVASGPDKERDLLEIYRRYQDRLLRDDLVDVEGQMWLARDRLAEAVDGETQGDLPGLESVRCVVVDGFTDFTPTQLEMLDLISRCDRRVVITLPLDDDRRDRMWFWTRRTFKAVRNRFGDRAMRIPISPADSPEKPLRPLWDAVFDLDSPDLDVPKQFRIIAAPGVAGEVSAVARRIKRLLLDGAPPGSIAVLARSMTPYRAAVERIFARHDIPVSRAPEPLTDVPVVRFLLNTADICPEFSFTAVLRTISNSYFRPEALGDFDATDAPVAELIVRQGNVLEGRESYARAADRLAWQAERTRTDAGDEDAAMPLGPVEVTAARIVSARKMLDALFDVVSSAGGDLVKIGDALDVRSAVMDQDDVALIARDLRALAILEGVTDQLGDDPPAPAELRAALSQVACPPPRGESLVDVIDVLDARAMRYKHVFLLGMGEGQFPVRPAENSLLGEQQRRNWSARGVSLDSRGDLAAREMLLFYLAASRCDESLTLTYSTLDSSAQTAGPGSFAASLAEPLDGIEAMKDCGQLVSIRPGTFLGDDVLTDAVAGWFDPAGKPDDSALAWATANAPQKLGRIARGIWAAHRRWKPGPPDVFDGRLADAALTAELRARYPGQVIFSPSAVNSFGQCPWQYFAKYVLKLEPLAEPQRVLEPTSRGQFVHNVLFSTMKKLSEAAGGPVRPERIGAEEMVDALDSAVTEESEPLEDQAPYPVLWHIQQKRMHRRMESYVLGLRESARETSCEHFELAFGMEGRPGEHTDPASRTEPVTLDTPAGKVRIRGKIDRVDRVEVDGEEGLAVVDYKTGRLPSTADIVEGRNLQLPLYAAAAAELLGMQDFGGSFHRIGEGGGTDRLEFSAADESRGVKKLGGYAAARRVALERLADFVTAMSDGKFDLLPTHDCPRYCPFRQICHYSPARAEVKTASPKEGES